MIHCIQLKIYILALQAFKLIPPSLLSIVQQLSESIFLLRVDESQGDVPSLSREGQMRLKKLLFLSISNGQDPSSQAMLSEWFEILSAKINNITLFKSGSRL